MHTPFLLRYETVFWNPDLFDSTFIPQYPHRRDIPVQERVEFSLFRYVTPVLEFLHESEALSAKSEEHLNTIGSVRR